MQQISTIHTWSLEVLEHLIQQKQHSRHSSTTLIICRERQDFFEQLLHQVLHSGARLRPDAPPSSQQAPDDHGEQRARAREHAFLTPIFQLLSSSKSINLVFCPTVSTLRAYLASFNPCVRQDPMPSRPPSQMLIIDLLALHHGTSEFTLQGLSRSFSSAVSTAYRAESSLTLIECKEVNDPTSPHRGPNLWGAQVSLLSGSVKIGQEGSRWAGRSITIRKIAARWFTFEDGKRSKTRTTSEQIAEEDFDEMLI
jgi:hypothetical protein